MERGELDRTKGIAISAHLEKRRVGHTMAQASKKALASYGYRAEMEEIYETSSLQEGSALAIYAETSSGGRLGARRNP
ncbi:MAG: hypothetical protein ACE5IE_01230 [Dehalococcoidia bacterium]